MKKIILVAAVLGLGACQDKGLTTQQQADGIQICQRAGAYAKVVTNEYGRAVRVHCQQETAEAICVKNGGIPIKSIWDGRLKNCIFVPKESPKETSK